MWQIDNLYKMGHIFKGTKLAQGEIDYQNSPISIREIE